MMNFSMIHSLHNTTQHKYTRCALLRRSTNIDSDFQQIPAFAISAHVELTCPQTLAETDSTLAHQYAADAHPVQSFRTCRT